MFTFESAFSEIEKRLRVSENPLTQDLPIWHKQLVENIVRGEREHASTLIEFFPDDTRVPTLLPFDRSDAPTLDAKAAEPAAILREIARVANVKMGSQLFIGQRVNA